jgi:hypothetical protein
MPTTLYDFDEFKRQQGITDADACLYVGTRWLLANGAQSDGIFNHLQPPSDRQELLTLQLEFCKHKLHVAERGFTETQKYITEQAHYCEIGAGLPPDESAYSDLKRLQAVVFKTREQIAIYRRELRQLAGPDRHEQYQERRSAQQAAAQAAVERARQIQI